jgi:hypothetical protein
MYESLIHFFDNFPDILQKPANIDIIKTTYLDFYQDKKDWLVKQYCIFMNTSKDTMMKFINEPDQDQVGMLKKMTDDNISFFSWLTNLKYKDEADNTRRNDFWLSRTAPNPDEYDYPASIRDYSGGVKDPLLARPADFR